MTSERRTPLYEAYHSNRYERQALISQYQHQYECRLVVLSDFFLQADSVPFLEETLSDADPSQELHILLHTMGGDGNSALRLVRQAQSRCTELTVIVPDQAKSAGTLFALGAHHIVMGPTSDLGPVDPQFPDPQHPHRLIAGKTLIRAVEYAEERIAARPETYPLHVSLLAGVSAPLLQTAYDEISRSGELIKEALSVVTEDANAVATLADRLCARLVDEPTDHAAIVSADDAREMGLPVRKMAATDEQWQAIWRLWTKYIVLNASRVYEGIRSSIVVPWPEADAE